MPGTGHDIGAAAARRFAVAGMVFFALATAGCSRPPDFRTVVLVTIDTLRADHVGVYGYPRPTTPFLDSLSETGVVFESAYSSSSHTAPSHATLLTALYPEAHGVLRNGSRLAPDRFETLAENLGDQGFESGAFTAVGFLRQLTEGFHHVDAHAIERGTKEFRLAEDTVTAALDWVAGRDDDRKLFLWIHLYDVHAHHRRDGPHVEFLRRLNEHVEADPEPFGAYLERTYGHRAVGRRVQEHLIHYDAQLAYTDRQIERLYRGVEKARSGASLWIVTSDHGEGLGNHGIMGHGRNLYVEQLRVPLIVHSSPNVWGPSRVDRMVRLVDIYPTVRELVAEAQEPSEKETVPIDGVSLVPLLEAPDAQVSIDAVFAQRRPSDGRSWRDELVLAAQSEREKYIYHSGRVDEYYDLVVDPYERVNLIEEDRPEAARLKDWVLREYARMHEGRPETSPEIEPEHLEELRALGYID